LLDALAPPDPLVDAAADDADAEDVLAVELLLLPQPETNTPLTTATANSKLSLGIIDPPALHPSRRRTAPHGTHSTGYGRPREG
jgi:hypothetical protein